MACMCWRAVARHAACGGGGGGGGGAWRVATGVARVAFSGVGRVAAAHTQAGQRQLPSQAYMRATTAGDITMDPAQLEALVLLDKLHSELCAFDPSPVQAHDEHVVHRYKQIKQERIKEAVREHEDTQRKLYGFTEDDKAFERHAQELKVDTKVLEEDLDNVDLPQLTTAPRGVYLWGSVGCGKSMLMDLFYDTLPVKQKLRIHFHSFMRDTLQHLHRLSFLCDEEHRAKYDHNMTHLVAKNIARQARVLCFDEMQIPDVGTAGILYRLFTHLHDYGVVVVATSNRPPCDLYQGHFKEALFEPFVRVVEENCSVFRVDSDVDYRELMPEAADHQGMFADPIFVGDDATDILQETWETLTEDKRVRPASVHVFGRNVSIPHSTREGHAYFDFSYLCGSALGPADYLAIARQFHSVFLAGIPKLRMSSRNEARRFITLIDALYECRTKLFAAVELPIDRLFLEVDDTDHDRFEIMHGDMLGEMMYDLGRDGPDVYKNMLFTGEEELFASKRCISRLNEMRSPSYLSQPHQPGLGMVGIDAAFLELGSNTGVFDVENAAPSASATAAARDWLSKRDARAKPKFTDKHFWGFGWWESLLGRKRKGR
ncbi:hypothetical protein PTSG_09426 [Salpingoeca rosetta]|uniref:Uncharacterized protein n=1 Tax=Salpingoeca rosetta (strain ATCC 50818 / BSB-021) TaxID=946362 RepID=F2UML1_SALR5|nr:uncharacterized protein PTSG_09426 [Salpingoeca rosetta]EGD78360.1 hypothetical protein PTSG_09426 [Salpingoeca rosetta]|eukprot:XP_004989683.1 hypothetical protein PTSG_09426 [Salpingoeca rosetta]